MKTEYGIPVPRGVPKDWRVSSIPLRTGDEILRKRSVPEEWGSPANCVGWYDRFGRCRLIVAHYSNGRSATVRIDANGNWKTTFGDV